MKLNLNGEMSFDMDAPFMLATVLSGDGIVNSQPLKKGDHFIIPNGVKKVELTGKMELILSNV